LFNSERKNKLKIYKYNEHPKNIFLIYYYGELNYLIILL